MKKIFILLFFILFFCSGCYDYVEINNLAIVSGVSIDYKDNKYNVAFEILNTKNKDDSPEKEKVYIAKGSGSSISEAFTNTTLEIAKMPYYAHIKTIIIDEEIAKNHLEEIIDYFLRDNLIRNIFYLVMAKNNTAFDILKNTDTNNPVVSTAIRDLIDNTEYTNNISSKLNYEKFVVNVIDKRKDTYISTIEIKNGILYLGNLGVFNRYKLQGYLSKKESATFNLINGTSNEMYFKINCPNDSDNFIVLSSVGKPNSKIEIKDKTVNIKTEIETRIIENHCQNDFKKIKTYESIQNILENNIKNDIEQVVNKLIEYNSDILKIKEIYYQQNKSDIDFRKLNYKYDAKAVINRNGLIYEVQK